MQYSQTTPVVGVAMDRFDGGYQSTVLRGVCEAARERGANVLAFVGGQLADDPARAGRSRVFELIGPESVDAVVVFGAALSHRAGEAGLAELCQGFSPLPLCSVGSPLPGATSVGIDNEAGMRDAIDHLVRSHNKRRIAFVRGPATNQEAEIRYAVYRQALEHAGLEFDAALVCEGDFALASGAAAVRELYDERSLARDAVDAITCANDAMARGVLEELSRRGLRVPRDVALVGFDDSEDARFCQPPLTTVRQPEVELGREAVRLALARAPATSGAVMLATELVRRRSCGCFGADAVTSVAPTESALGFQAALIERRQVLLAELARAARGHFGALGRGWEAQLLSMLTEELLGNDGLFQNGFDDFIERCLQARIDVDACHDVLTVLRRHVMACLSSDVPRRKNADRLLDQARISASRAAERFQAGERMALADHVPAFSELCVELATARSLTALGETLHDGSRLGVSECHLLLADGESYRLALSHSERRGLRYPGVNGGARNLMRRALPDHGHQAMAVLPLFHAERHLGFALVTLGSRLPIAYEALRLAFSRALDAMQG